MPSSCRSFREIINTPPVSPNVGDLYLVGTSPTGDFVSQNNKIAQYLTGGWRFYTPFKWMDAIIENLNERYSFDGTNWVPFGLLMKDTGEYLRIGHWQDDITVSGSDIDTSELIPDRSSVVAVNIRVLTAVTAPVLLILVWLAIQGVMAQGLALLRTALISA